MFSNHLVRYLFSSLIFLISFLAKSQDEGFVMSQIGPNNLLDIPLDLNYGPDGYLWVTEKTNGGSKDIFGELKKLGI